MPRPLLRRLRKDQRKVTEFSMVSLPYLVAPLPVFLDAPELMDSDRRLDIHHIIFVATIDDIVVLVALVAESPPCVFAHAVEREDFDLIRPRLICRQDHSSLARCHILGHVEAEASKSAECAGVFSL